MSAHAGLPMTPLMVIALVAGIPQKIGAQTPGDITWSPFTLQVRDSEVPAELGRLTVPERHEAGTGTVELAFVRLASRAGHPGPPIVYLDGGPGGSGYGIAQVPAYYQLFDALRDVGDVILLSQRGAGLSRPKLVCDLSSPVPDDVFTTRERMLAILRPEVERCTAKFRNRGVDVGAYNTQESADDLESLRRALNVDSINLLGFSYGTHLGLSALRRHGDRIGRAVLIGTEGPDQSLKLPSTSDRQFRHLAALVAADPVVAAAMPDLFAAVDTLLRRLDAEPVKLDIEAWSGPRTIALGGDGMRYLLRLDLGDTNDHPRWPAMLRLALDGNYGMVTRLASRRFNELRRIPLMSIAMDCASGASPERLARIRRERRTTLLGDMMDSWFPEICEAFPEARLDDAFRSPFVSVVPTLFLAGTLDANTPPWQAREVAWGWPNATHIVVDDAGHEAIMPWAPAQDVIVRFFRGEDVRDRRLKLASMQFVNPEEERKAQEAEAMMRRDLRALLVRVALHDGRITSEERAAVAGEYKAAFGITLADDALNAEARVAAEGTRRADDIARELAGHLSDRIKTILLQATSRVAMANGTLDPGEAELLARIGAALGMSAETIREALEGMPNG